MARGGGLAEDGEGGEGAASGEDEQVAGPGGPAAAGVFHFEGLEQRDAAERDDHAGDFPGGGLFEAGQFGEHQDDERGHVGEDGGVGGAGAAEADDEEELVERDAEQAEKQQERDLGAGPAVGRGAALPPVDGQYQDTGESHAQAAQEHGRDLAEGELAGDVIARPAEDHEGNQGVEAGRWGRRSFRVVCLSAGHKRRWPAPHQLMDSSRTVMWRM
jgi:hypothetical protein